MMGTILGSINETIAFAVVIDCSGRNSRSIGGDITVGTAAVFPIQLAIAYPIVHTVL